MTLYHCKECHNALWANFARKLPDSCPACGAAKPGKHSNPYSKVYDYERD